MHARRFALICIAKPKQGNTDMTLTNETRTANRTFWFVAINGKPAARLCKQAKGWARWSVLKGDEWKQFSSRDEALAFAAI